MTQDSVVSHASSKHLSMDKRLHDQLLEHKPESASHDRETCELCNVAVPDNEKQEGGSLTVSTYTQEDLDAAVAEAVAPFEAKLAELTSAAQESEVEGRIAAVKADADAQVEEIRADLDKAVLEAQGARAELESYKAELEALAEEERLANEIASRRDERLARVKEVASFPDEYLDKNADRFAAMSEETFEAQLADWQALAPKGTNGDSLPKHTGLSASRETDTSKGGMAAVKDLMGLRFTGVDTRKI